MRPEREGADVACAHEAAPFGSPLCTHLRTGSDAFSVPFLRWFLGVGVDTDMLCLACADARSLGVSVVASRVCEPCYRRATEDVGDLVGSRGQPQILTRIEPFETARTPTVLPAAIGTVVDLAPVEAVPGSRWVLLTGDGALIEFDADTKEWSRRGGSSVAPEPDAETYRGNLLRKRLHISPRGEFAAVVNDFGRRGQIIDLRSGRTTLALDGGDYHPETVPFSFAFAELRGRTFAIHRTSWHRLDVSDPATGRLLSDRGPTDYSSGQERPAHYLDYFHGALLVSPSGTRILDDGWVWHPVGIPTSWSLELWLENDWESEDGPSRVNLCGRSYYWNAPAVWLDDTRVAIGGLGDDDNEIVPGVRIFDASERAPAEPPWSSTWKTALEIKAFVGPAGTFFSDGTALFSADETGLSRWDPASGERTGQLPGFRPSRYHRGARELVELRDGVLVRLRI